MEALNLTLRAVARAGDVIAVESPTYFGVLEAIQSLGMRAIEIPTHPSEGMSLELLESSIRKHRIKACVVMTNGHNPLGYVLPDDYKKLLAELTAKHDVALIEDNIYGDLAFGARQPKVAKAFDRTGNVLLCSSFSKVLAPGFRVGWVHAGRYQEEVERLKFMNTVATASLPQLVIAEYLESGGYDRYVGRLRNAFAEQVRIMSQAAAKYFPEGTRITRPDAGYLLWVELPKRVDAVKLFRAALAANISVVPGPIFSATGRFRNCIRISCGYRWSDVIDRALVDAGQTGGDRCRIIACSVTLVMVRGWSGLRPFWSARHRGENLRGNDVGNGRVQLAHALRQADDAGGRRRPRARLPASVMTTVSAVSGLQLCDGFAERAARSRQRARTRTPENSAPPSRSDRAENRPKRSARPPRNRSPSASSANSKALA